MFSLRTWVPRHSGAEYGSPASVDDFSRLVSIPVVFFANRGLTCVSRAIDVHFEGAAYTTEVFLVIIDFFGIKAGFSQKIYWR